jgi:hypothetical protein
MTEVDPLSGLTPVRPGTELREPVLGAARNALATRGAERTAWERMWRSRPLRLGWAVACLALVAGHLVLTLRQERPRAEPARPLVATIPAPSPELREALYLPPVERLTVNPEGGLTRPAAGANPGGET